MELPAPHVVFHPFAERLVGIQDWDHLSRLGRANLTRIALFGQRAAIHSADPEDRLLLVAGLYFLYLAAMYKGWVPIILL